MKMGGHFNDELKKTGCNSVKWSRLMWLWQGGAVGVCTQLDLYIKELPYKIQYQL
jgi:hypothetical protein